MKPELPILIKARAKIADPENWGKGIRSVNGGHRTLETCCAVEAILETGAGDRSSLGAAYATLGRAIGLRLRATVTLPIIVWNDAPERTHAQVLAAFDKAIASAS